EISKTDQEEIETESLKNVTRELIHNTLLSHKDKGVKAYVACCISDLLRLYAPDAPYTDKELRLIFEFFVRQLQNIANTNGTYFDLYFHLLENLARVKIVLLILDLQNYEDLLCELFKSTFDIVRPDMSNTVRLHMADILEQLINESHSLPQDVIDIVLAQFLQKRKDENPTAYRLACDVCKASTEKLQRYVCQYFTDVIVAAGKTGTPTEELSDFKTAHDLIKELNRSAPGLLLNVIPQLEEELKLDDLNLRMLATQVLGEMFSEKDSTLASRYDNVWKMWLLRRNDKIAEIRCAWTEYCLPLYINHHELAKQVNEAIITKMSDPDEKVRVAVCKVFSKLEYECASKLVDKELFIELAKRCRDRKVSVRQQAINALARLYNLAYIEIVDHDANAIEKFGWIPSELLNTLYTNDNEIIACVEKALHEEILSNNEDSVRMDHILVIFGSLDAKAKKGFFSLFQRQRDLKNSNVHNELQDNGTSEEVENLSNTLNQIVRRIADKLPDPLKSVNHLSTFPQNHDARVYKLIRDCMNPQSDYKTVRQSAKDALKRIEQIAPSSLETFSILIRRISLTIINKDLIPFLMTKIKSTDSELQSESSIVAHEFFKDISSRFPAIFRPHLDKLIRALKEEDSLIGTITLITLEYTHFNKFFQRESIQRLMKFALEGSCLQAKFAAIVLSHTRHKQQICGELLKVGNQVCYIFKQFYKIVPKLSITSPSILANLSVLSQCVLYSPKTYEEKSDAITNFIVKELIMKSNQGAAMETEVDWVDDDELDDECKAKVLGLKVLVNRLLAVSETEAVAEIAKPVFKLLWTLIRGGGEILPDKSTSLSFQSRLRLAAARSILKLAQKKIYDEMITVEQFQELALMIQDPCYQVRLAFASRLVKYCGGYQLHARFLSIFFLIAHDPMKDIKDMVKLFFFLLINLCSDNSTLIDMTLVRLIHLLSHHPDFSCDPESLREFIVYINFFLETIANRENVQFLFHIVTRLKQVRDAQPLDKCENIYTLSDLTQHLIQTKCKTHSWSLSPFPGQSKLPSELFKSIPNAEVVSEVSIDLYIATLVGMLSSPVLNQ
ncbi:armadillo-type protein, partial [Gigaspora rosea]